MLTLRKYFYVLRIALSERLVYRTDFFLSTLMRFAPMVSTILLWRRVTVVGCSARPPADFWRSAAW